jgi:hypothetical protein
MNPFRLDNPVKGNVRAGDKPTDSTARGLPGY